MPMTHYSTSDLSRKSGDIIAEALRRPVTITQRNKPRLVLLSIEDYRRLAARADTRKAGRLETMSDELFADLKKAVTAYEQDGDDVLVLFPITSQAPSPNRFAAEIPEMEKRRAGLDATLRLWIILDEYNQ